MIFLDREDVFLKSCYTGDVVHLKIMSTSVLVLNRYEDVEELLVKRANIWSGRPENRLVNDLSALTLFCSIFIS